MDGSTLLALAVVVFGWSVLAERLASWNLTGPLVFLASGFILGNATWGVVGVDIESSVVHHLAEITLVLVLFVDASTVRVPAARHDLRLTSRLLGIGLPLSIVAGTAVALALFPSLPLALAGLIGASLAPTDAALSASIIADERLPIAVRRVLNVESGMNDGIATPLVTLCIAVAATELGIVQHSYEDGLGALGELAIGVGVGVVIAFVGGRALHAAHQRGWTQVGSRRMATLALAIIPSLVAIELGGNQFVAAFIGGLVFGAAAPSDAEPATEVAELVGRLLSLVLWFIFGGGFLLPALERLDARVVVYAIASLTVVRMVPVAISLIGAEQAKATVAFIGWFGPRGLASVVFALLAIEELGDGNAAVLAAVDTMALTIVLSVVAHGITARPLATRYLRSLDRSS
jgi:NhaP-type Na+/H+ or K+/H+ antiporter